MSQQETLPGRPALVSLQQIDAVCDRFEIAWRSGQRPDIAEFLTQVPANVRARLFRDLLSLDLEYRRRLGEQPDAVSYYKQFPEFAVQLAPRFQARTSNSTEIVSDPRGRPGSPPIGPSAIPGSHGEERPGFLPYQPQAFKEAGYEVLGELGRGGMGVVLKAHQSALNRTVAVKVVKSGSFASESELNRFQNEAEAVAQLDHPHIVPIYEVGQCGGQHFFSMKLVNGTSLDRRLEEFARDPRASARLVATVAQAVQHAHAARHPAPGPQAGECDGRRKRRAACDGLRPGQAARREPGGDTIGCAPRHAIIHVAGAGHRIAGSNLDGDRRLRSGHDSLRPAGRPGTVCRHDPGRHARDGAQPDARASESAQLSGAARPRDHLPQVPGERTAAGGIEVRWHWPRISSDG